MVQNKKQLLRVMHHQEIQSDDGKQKSIVIANFVTEETGDAFEKANIPVFDMYGNKVIKNDTR